MKKKWIWLSAAVVACVLVVAVYIKEKDASPGHRLDVEDAVVDCAAIHDEQSASSLAAPITPAPDYIRDPIPEDISVSDIAVRAEEFVQLPKTEDIGVARGRFNAAHARIQGLVSVPDGSGRLAIIDQRGKVYLVDAEGNNLSLYLDLIHADVGFYAARYPVEMGLMGIAFHPDFARQGEPGHGKFYTAYSASSDSGVADYFDDDAESHESVVREWTTTDIGAGKFTGTSREVLRVGQFGKWHNIGNIAFNPGATRGGRDYGMLYMGFGDGGGNFDPRGYSQSLLSPLGSILRINPLANDGERAYGIPTGNPFVGRDDALPEIWAYGLRHPQHLSWSWDGRLFFIDIGQDNVEEINLGVVGGNYGWPLREGSFATGLVYQDAMQSSVYPLPECDAASFVYPIAQFDHDRSEGVAIGGGYAYQGEAIPALRDKFLFTELVWGLLLYIDADDVEPGRPQTVYELRVEYDESGGTLLEIAGMHDSRGRRVDLRLGRDDGGEIYLLTKGDGMVRRLVAGPGNKHPSP